MRHFIFSFLTLPLTLALILGAVPAHAATASGATVALDRILIVVDDSIITRSEVDARLASARANLRKRNIPMPPETVIRRQVMDALILEQLQVDLAARHGIEVSENELEQTIANIARENRLSLKDFLAQAKKDGIGTNRLREEIRRQLVIRKLVDIEINRQIRVSESEAEEYLSGQGGRNAGIEFDLSHIVITIPDSATSEQRQAAARLAADVRRKLLAGEAFEKMAITYSKGPNALKGGALGWREAGRLPEVFLKALQPMTPGNITPVLESTNGYHILRLNQKRGGDTPAVVTQTEVRHILLKPGTGPSAARATGDLLRLRKRLLAGEKFEELARAYSDDKGSAAQGGSLGWMSPGQLVPEFEKEMNRLKPGEISQPVRTRFGVHLIQVLGRRDKDVGDKQRRANARQQIHARKAEERLQQWLRQLRDQAYVEIISPDNQ